MNVVPLFASEPHTRRLGHVGNLGSEGLALKYQAEVEPAKDRKCMQVLYIYTGSVCVGIVGREENQGIGWFLYPQL